MAHSWSGSSSTVSSSHRIGVLVFLEGGNWEPTEKPLEQGREPTTNSTHMWRQVWKSNPCHITVRWVLSPLVPCLLFKLPGFNVGYLRPMNFSFISRIPNSTKLSSVMVAHWFLALQLLISSKIHDLTLSGFSGCFWWCFRMSSNMAASR